MAISCAVEPSHASRDSHRATCSLRVSCPSTAGRCPSPASTPPPSRPAPHLLYAARHASSAAAFLACAAFCRARCSRRASAFWFRIAFSWEMSVTCTRGRARPRLPGCGAQQAAQRRCQHPTAAPAAGRAGAGALRPRHPPVPAPPRPLPGHLLALLRLQHHRALLLQRLALARRLHLGLGLEGQRGLQRRGGHGPKRRVGGSEGRAPRGRATRGHQTWGEGRL